MNYNQLKADISAVVRANGAHEITGDALQQILKLIVDSLGEHYQFAGTASPDYDPEVSDERVVYIAFTEGDYPAFGGLHLDAGEVALLVHGAVWDKETLPLLTTQMLVPISEATEAALAAAQRANTAAGVSEQDHTRAEQDHVRAEGDHSRAEQDHTQAAGDHTQAATDHAQAGTDHTRAEQDHARAEQDHSTASDDHTTSTALIGELQNYDDKLTELSSEVTELEEKNSEISKEVVETDEDFISVEDNNGNEVFHLDKNGLNAKNVKSNDKDVLTEHQDISGLATKEEVARKQDVIPVSQEETTSSDDEYIFASDDYDGKGTGKVFAKVNNQGVYAKEFYDINGNPINRHKASLVLPHTVPCVVGHEQSIYFEHIIKNGWLKDFIVTTSWNRSKSPDTFDAHTFMLHSAGNTNLNVRLEDSYGKIVDDENIVLSSVSKAQGGSFKVCVIGDSKTDNATKLAELLNLCEKDGNIAITLLGRVALNNYKDSDGNTRATRSEGFSGRNIIDVCNSATLNGVTNIFYDAAVSGNIKFNYAKGLSSLGDTPDILWIDHGENQRNQDWNLVKSCYDAIISSVKSVAPNTKIVISIQESRGLAKRLGYNQTEDSSNNNKAGLTDDNKCTLDKYISAYDNRESEGIFICPQYLNIDLYNDYPLIEASCNSRNNKKDYFVADPIHMGVNTSEYNNTKTYKKGDIVCVSGDNKTTDLYACLVDNTIGVAPTDSAKWAKSINCNAGYYKIADMYYATIKYIASKN